MAKVTTTPAEPMVVVTMSMEEACAMYDLFGNSCECDLDGTGLPNLFEDLEPVVRDFTGRYDRHVEVTINPY